MITRVSKVLIANAACPASYTTAEALGAGEVALFDENKNILKNGTEAVAAGTVYVGICKGQMDVINPQTGAVEKKKQIEFSAPIQKNETVSCVLQEHVAPVQEKIEFNLTNTAIVIGHRYVLRIVYKDMFEAPGQFTHTYEVEAKSETPQDLCDAFVKAINAHKNRRISVTGASNKITLTALEKTDNEGVESLNEYSVVSMDATLYYTIPGALLSNTPSAIPGVTKTVTPGTAGKGHWKQVRDRELRCMGYKGHVFTGAYPSIEQKRNVVEGAEYDYMTIENDNSYLSPDNQYVKRTPLTTELYVKKGSLKTSQFKKNLESFISGKAVS